MAGVVPSFIDAKDDSRLCTGVCKVDNRVAGVGGGGNGGFGGGVCA